MFSRLFAITITFILILFAVPNIWIYKNLAKIKGVTCRLFVSITLLMIFMPINIYFLFCFVIYRIIIKCILWMYHGRKFNHMLDGQDRIYTVQVTSPHVILFLIKYNQPFDFYAKMSEIIEKALKEKFEDHKVFSTISSFLGYSYLVKNKVPCTDYIKPLPLINNSDLSKTSLLNAIEEHTQGFLPNNNNGLWEVFIGTQEIIWRNHPDQVGESFYPIVLRFHPCVSNILYIMNNILPPPYEGNNAGEASLDAKNKITRLSKFKNCMKKAGYFFMTPSVFFVNALAMNREDNVMNPLYGPKLCHTKTLCILDESQPNNIYLINSIKEKFPGTTFQDILLTAFTASLEEYYAKVVGGTRDSRPRFILSENYVSMRSIENMKEDSENRSSTIMLKLPIGLRCNVGKIPIVCMLQAIAKERKLLKHSIESKVHYEILKIFFTYLPSPLLKLFINKYKFTTNINNLPGPNEVRTIDGHTVANVYVWTPHRGNTGISLTIATYDGRLQLTLSVDKVLIPNRNDVQMILDEIYKNLIMMNNIPQQGTTSV